MRTPLYKRYIGIILGRFPGRYTRPKTGIFSRSQYELSHLQNFVLRHIGGIAPRLSRDCPISRSALTFTHGEISQNFFAIFRKSPASHSAGIRRTRQNSLLCKNSRLCCRQKKFFQKFFSKFFPENSRLSYPAISYIPKKIFQKIFSKKFGRSAETAEI